jgi:agmatinase
MKHTSSRQPGFLASEFASAPAGQAAFHVIPAPMELSVSYGGGTARGPLAILRASDQLEAHDRGVSPGAQGIHTQPVIKLPRGAGAAAWTDAIEARVAQALAAKARPLVLGGEHTVTLGSARAFAAARRKIGFIHFDAHADLRDTYEGSPLSHASVMRRVAELGFPIVQFGTRAYSLEEAGYRRKHRITAFDAELLVGAPIPVRLLPAGFPKALFITFDVDGLDPSQMPATGTPVAGGLFWHQAMQILDRVVKGRTIVGADVVELAPIAGLHYADFTAAQLVHRLLALMTP